MSFRGHLHHGACFVNLATDRGGVPRVNATTIENALTDALRRRGGYVILEAGRDRFIQATPGTVEYRCGERFYRFEPAETDIDLVTRLFVSYWCEDGRWKTLVAWEDVTSEFEARSQRFRLWAVLILIGGVLLAAWLVHTKH